MAHHHDHSHTPRIGRRGFLTGLAATAAAAAVGVPRITLADRANAGTKFVFVFALGGWDPLAAFAPLFDASLLQMERDAYRVTEGNFALVGHQGRENLESFFRTWHDDIVLLNGVSTRSVAHEVCTRVSMTGASSGSESDWPTLIASQGGRDKAMPALVLNGPTFPGDLESLVARVGEAGQLDTLASSEGLPLELDLLVEPEGITDEEVGSILDAFVRRRAEAVARKTEDALVRRRHEEMARSLERAGMLKRRAQREAVDEEVVERYYGDAEGAGRHFARAVATLGEGLSRTVTLSDDSPWDTHGDNRGQTPYFNQLFGYLDGLMRHLGDVPGERGGTLYDETVVVVLSEMGRTPRFNEGEEEEYEGGQTFQGGRDHWPYTSALIMGGPIKGGRTLGGYTERFTGIGVDPSTGELDTNSVGISSAQLGATLLAIADIDPGGLIPNASPILGLV